MMKQAGKYVIHRQTLFERLLRGLTKRFEERFIPSIYSAGAAKRITTRGLPLKAYRELSRIVKGADGEVFIEIGAGRGTSTVVIAQAISSKKSNQMLITADKFEGGDAQYGDRDENMAKFYNLLDHFNVRDYVTVFPHYVTSDSMGDFCALINGRKLMGVFIDADGRVDRLLPPLYGLLDEHTPIIFDDYSNDIKWFRQITDRRPQGGTKHMRCYRMVKTLEDRGLIRINKVIYGTVFATKSKSGDLTGEDLSALTQANDSVDELYKKWLNKSLA